MVDELIGRAVAGKYRVIAEIGRGATATVYRAEQDAEPREIALKCLFQHLTSDATFVGRFRRESNLAARIAHANIVRLLDFGQDGPTFFIAMELLRGKELGKVLKVERRLAERRAAGITMGVLDALAVAHDLGAIHRDLKPDNIILEPTPEGEAVKVLDFGIAKLVAGEGGSGDGDEGSTALTKVGVAVGSPAYMSPEQCRGESTVGPRSDLYACGVLLYEMLTGRTPFVGDSPIDIAMGHLRQMAQPMPELVSGLHPGLDAVVRKLLEKKQDDRYPTAGQAKAALAAILGELSTSPLVPAAQGAGLGTQPLGPSPLGAPMAPPFQPQPPAFGQPQPPAFGQPQPQAFGQPQPPAFGQPQPQQQPMFGAPVGPPGPAPLPAQGPPTAAAPSGGSSLVWLLVPVSVVLGIGVGFAAFVLSR